MPENIRPDNELKPTLDKQIKEIPGWEEIPHEKDLPEFQRLRRNVHAQREKEFLHRIETNPDPTEEEYDIDAYFEEIEPQCREAILKMRKKGYETYSSGFGSDNKLLMVYLKLLVQKLHKF